jgi:hypothetical protein
MYIKAADKAALCANCHGATVDGEALAAQVDDLMTNLQTAIAANFKRRVLLGGPTVTLYYVTNWSNPTGTFVVPVVITSATTVTANATSAAVYISGTSRNFNSLVTNNVAPWTPFITPADRLNKAVFNGKMLSIDDSEGVHNPSFILSVLNNTIAAMKIDTP